MELVENNSWNFVQLAGIQQHVAFGITKDHGSISGVLILIPGFLYSVIVFRLLSFALIPQPSKWFRFASKLHLVFYYVFN